MSRTKKFLTRLKEELWNPEMRAAYLTGALLGLVIVARSNRKDIQAVSSTQDRILETLEANGIIENLRYEE